MSDRHYETERTMTKPSAGGTVTPTTTGDESSRAHRDSDDSDNSNDGDDDVAAVASRTSASRTESKSVQRKRRRTEPASPRTGIPRKTPRWTGEEEAASECPPDESATGDVPEEFQRDAREQSSCSRDSSTSATAAGDVEVAVTDGTKLAAAANKRVDVDDASEAEKSTSGVFRESANNPETLTRKPPMHPDAARRRLTAGGGLAGASSRRDDSARLRKTIQWLEEGARKLREDLAEARAELHEERRAAKIARRDVEVAVREARAAETARHQRVIAELKTRLSQSPSRTTTEPSSASAKAELLKDENHRREISAVKKRLAEADATIRKLRSNCLDTATGGATSGKRRRLEATTALGPEIRKLDGEVKALRAANKKLEDKLNMVCAEAEKIRIMELRIQHENHESELSALKKSLRSDTIRMMDEIKSKDREIERLGRLARENRKSRPRDDDTMRKLRENENGHQIRLAARIEDKIPQVENVIDLCKGECVAATEVERLRELAIEQQEFIEVLRQAVKEKERKLDQLSNKRRKEEFYKQWLELEPVAEVDDEEEHEEGDSALSSAPSSLSPQPGGCGQWSTSGVTREAYEAVLLEIDEIQTKYLEEQRELAHAKSQVRDLEKALLQETRGSQNSRRALSDKLRKLEERETALLAEISELRDQNELLEFRVLELEESPGSRETPDTADSGIMSPEPINIFKQEQNNKQRDRAIATVLPFSSYTHPASPVAIRKPPLSLQESGIFEADDDDDDDIDEDGDHLDDDDDDDAASNETSAATLPREVVELTCRGTQTEAPVGELLQEVQRLQELRERIQERAVKVPSGPAIGVESTASVDGDAEKSSSSSLRDKIRELEETIARRDEADERRAASDFVAKQREEDLLDENYRLTERVYWLENELRGSATSTIDAATMTEAAAAAAAAGTGSSQVDAETLTLTEKMRKNATIDAETMTLTKETKKNATIDAETMTLTKKTIDAATMTLTEKMRKKETIDAETMTLTKETKSNATIDAETMTLTKETKSNATIDAEMMTLTRKNKKIDVETMTLAEEKTRGSGIARWNIFQALPEDLDHAETAKVARMEVEVDGDDVVAVVGCAGCESLRRDCDERVERMASRYRGQLDDLERREVALQRTMLRAEVARSRLEAEHARKLEDIGRRLEEKVECNRRITGRVADAPRSRGAAKISLGRVDGDQVDGISRILGDASSVIFSADAARDEADAAMDVDPEENHGSPEATRTTPQVDLTTRTEDDECLNCRAKRSRIRDETAESSGRVSDVELHKNIVETPTEVAVEATEDNVEGSATTTTTTSEGGVSRVHLLPDEERPAPEPAEETRRVNVSETELDKKQVVYFRWR